MYEIVLIQSFLEFQLFPVHTTRVREDYVWD